MVKTMRWMEETNSFSTLTLTVNGSPPGRETIEALTETQRPRHLHPRAADPRRRTADTRRRGHHPPSVRRERDRRLSRELRGAGQPRALDEEPPAVDGEQQERQEQRQRHGEEDDHLPGVLGERAPAHDEGTAAHGATPRSGGMVGSYSIRAVALEESVIVSGSRNPRTLARIGFGYLYVTVTVIQ